jgi:hypothetical protein
MSPELVQLRALAVAIASAEAALDTAYESLYRAAANLLRDGEATLAEVSAASGLDQGQLLELLSGTLSAKRSAAGN